MRKLIRLDAATEARKLASTLIGSSIDARVETEGDGAEVWVLSDADLDRARALLDAWRHDPDAEPLRAARRRASEADDRRRSQERRRSVQVERLDRARRELRVGPVTIVTLLLATALTLLGIPGVRAVGDAIVSLPAVEQVEWAFIDDLRILPGPDGPYVPFLGAVRRGEVWRLLTPMFVHTGGLIHLGFNGYWIWIFGRQIETRKGSLTLAALVLTFGALSMLAQYAIGWSMIDLASVQRGTAPSFTLGPLYLGGPVAGGLSGALYGLFGYIWAKSATDRFSGLGLPSSTIAILVGWLLVCFTGAVGPIANIAHTAGLLVGVLWGAGGHRIHRAW